MTEDNLTIILNKYRPLYGSLYTRHATVYRFIGILDSEDDLYFHMRGMDGSTANLSCVGDIENFGFVLQETTE